LRAVPAGICRDDAVNFSGASRRGGASMIQSRGINPGLIGKGTGKPAVFFCTPAKTSAA